MGNEEKKFVKHDEHKIMLSLVEPSFVNGVAKVLTFGATKYGPNKWKKCDDINRYKNAAYRHWNSYLSGEMYDPETGLPHLDHLATNIMFIRYLEGEHNVQH